MGLQTKAMAFLIGSQGRSPQDRRGGSFPRVRIMGAHLLSRVKGLLRERLSIDPQWMEVVARLDLGQLWSLTSPDQRPALFKGSALCRSSITRDADLWSVKGTADIGDLSVDHELFLIDPPGEADRATFEFDFIPDKEIRIKQLLWEPGNPAWISLETILCPRRATSRSSVRLRHCPWTISDSS